VTGGKDAGLVDDGMEEKEEGVHGRGRRGVGSGSSRRWRNQRTSLYRFYTFSNNSALYFPSPTIHHCLHRNPQSSEHKDYPVTIQCCAVADDWCELTLLYWYLQ
jgi:hypothetical protein